MDLTKEEFKSFYLGFKPVYGNNTKHVRVNADPDTVDWSQKGAVTPVKD
jgi:hypothetical protein